MSAYKGIQRGDKNFRHFTFDENDFIEKNGTKYYKVNYGKSKFDGPDAEDEINYIDAPNIIVLGGKKPSFLNPVQQESVVKNQSVSEPVVEISNLEQDKGTEPKQASKKQQEQKRPVGRPKKTKPDACQMTTSPEVSKILLSNMNLVKKNTFEYDIKFLDANDMNSLKEQLNELGTDGWELCGFDVCRTLFKDMKIMAIFKRIS